LVRQTTNGTITYNSSDDTYTYMGPGHFVVGVSVAPSVQHEKSSHEQSRTVISQLRALAATQQANELHQLLVYSAIALAVMAAVSVLLGWIVAGRVLRPIRTISASARRISATNLHQRLALDGPNDEFKDLSTTLNSLLERLDTSFESQRRFVANASHELRTPLTVERTLLQVALADPDMTFDRLRGVCEKLLLSGVQQERLIDALLTLASSERGLDEQEPFDLADVVSQTLNREFSDPAGGIDVHTKLCSAPTIGDPHLVERLVSNLLDNAIRHNHDHGQVVVSTGKFAERPFISVSNTGPRIPEKDIGRLLEPFQQLGTQRTGHRNGNGLGLAIVAAIASAHFADLIVKARPEGGLIVEVDFKALEPSTNEADRYGTVHSLSQDLSTVGPDVEERNIVRIERTPSDESRSAQQAPQGARKAFPI
jgi:signal transduction histidine kinase